MFGSDALDDLQPYVGTGLGDGRTEPVGSGGGGGLQQSTFVFRLGAGVDGWMADGCALSGKGSMQVTPGTKDWLTSGAGSRASSMWASSSASIDAAAQLRIVESKRRALSRS